MIVIMAVGLIVVGPEKMPELARSLAKGVVELKKAANALKESLHADDIDANGDTGPEGKLAAAYSRLPDAANAPPPPTDAMPPAPGEATDDPAQQNPAPDSGDKESEQRQ